MRINKLGNTDLNVSEICLGSMTWGRQNTEGDAHQQIDFALSKGINFIDTAEMYAVPANKASFGLTEKYIGTWLSKNPSKRKDIILASKVTGPSRNLSYISDLPMGFSRERIKEALFRSLKRLQTDYIDLYQLHWPERKSNMFGQRNYVHNAEWEDNFKTVLETLNELKKTGAIRHYGLSNETPWGVMKTCNYADQLEVSRYACIQNPYNLLNRNFEHNLSEVSLRENIPLLAYSPLAMGILSGKYNLGTDKPNNRLNQFKNTYPRYSSEVASKATQAYLELAKNYNVNLTQLSLKFVTSRPFVGSNIIGATSLPQLKENIESNLVNLSNEILEDIESINNLYPNPVP